MCLEVIQWCYGYVSVLLYSVTDVFQVYIVVLWMCGYLVRGIVTVVLGVFRVVL